MMDPVLRSGLFAFLVVALGSACSSKRSSKSEEQSTLPSPEAGPARTHDTTRGSAPPLGAWHTLTRDGQFYAAICALGERPKLGAMFSPEHSSIRDSRIAESVSCPPPMPTVAPPPAGARVLVTVADNPFGAEQRPPPEGVFATAKVISPGSRSSQVELASGQTQQVDNAHIIAFPDQPAVEVGDLILAPFDEAPLGVMRAIVIKGGTAERPRVRRLSGFDSGLFGEVTATAGSFRPIGQRGDIGSLVAIPLADRVELAMIVARTGEFIVAMDANGSLRSFVPSSVTILPIRLYPSKGQSIYVPWSGSDDLKAGKAVANHKATGHVAAVTETFPDSEPDWYGIGCISDVDLSLGLYRTIDL